MHNITPAADTKACSIRNVALAADARRLQKRGPISVKEYITLYKLDDPDDTDVLLYVSSLCAASKRGARDQKSEQELVHKCEAPFASK